MNLSKYGIKEKYITPLLLESWQRGQASARMASLQHPKDGPISAGAPFCAVGAKKQSGLKSLSRPQKAKETKRGFLHSEVDQILSGGAGSLHNAAHAHGVHSHHFTFSGLAGSV